MRKAKKDFKIKLETQHMTDMFKCLMELKKSEGTTKRVAI